MARKTSSTNHRSAVAERVEGKIQKASELPEHGRFLIYGRSGAGKTRLAATAPKVLLVDINEQGTASVRRDTDPYVFPVEMWAELQDVYWYLATGEHDFQSVALDGVSSMQTLCMKFVLGDEASRDASRDPDMPSRQVWGKVGELMKTQITNFRNLPMNVIFTALQRSRSTGEDDDDTFVLSPNCSPSIPSDLEAAVDMMGFLTIQNVSVKVKKGDKVKRVTRQKRRLMVGPSEKYYSKDRYGLFGDFIEAPDMSEIITTVYKED